MTMLRVSNLNDCVDVVIKLVKVENKSIQRRLFVFVYKLKILKEK
jgi:hypothetical protein